ncbi:zinc transport system ATP-binding protein [Saccharicrinis carchari]|uniref:Zinc transport system ATP-binding protein n=1 Tax=Saccharicrinis carchari TaxID=1168039 RepID=A0A521CP25_SACCC|nr:metal ABC transporter ATP-binding protein [Saccharicrinis carchari]SMO60420.1 zinc transport system ATP-binding protein [Saccharicrinis carchari]
MEPIIKLSDVYAGYTPNKAVLKQVSLDVYPNDFIGIIGPNGGGKSTLLKVILGLLQPFSGTIEYYNQQDYTKVNLGYLPQLNNNDKSFPIKVIDVVLSGLMGKKGMIKSYTSSEKEQARQLLSFVKLDNYANSAIGALSGGQMQRVYLCRAIINSPKVLILDEPNNFVDKQFETELYDLLKELNKKMAILLVSHDVGIISAFIKTIACVNETLHYHKTNKISEEMLKTYHCPIELIAHGHVPHRVLHNH